MSGDYWFSYYVKQWQGKASPQEGNFYVYLFMFALFFIFLLPSCKPDTIQNSTGWNILIYRLFKADAARLQKLNHLRWKP